MRVSTIIKITIIVVLLVGIFVPTFVSLAAKFTATDTYYSHGFLVPVVSGYLIWRKRKKLKTLPVETSQAGLFILIGGLMLHIISSLLKINFGSYVSLVIVLEGLVLYLFGKKVNHQLLFPLAFLVFMIPLPNVIIIGLSFKMKMLASQVSTNIINQMGISAVRDGSTIYLPNGKLMVGDPCSGLRSLISLLALGALFTQFIQSSNLKKNILFLSAAPIALASNALRIIALLWVTYVYGEQAALGFFHDFTGMMVFVVAFLGLFLVTKALRCRFEVADAGIT